MKLTTSLLVAVALAAAGMFTGCATHSSHDHAKCGACCKDDCKSCCKDAAGCAACCLKK